MSFKIIFTDIDGTLLDANRELSESTIYQLTKINKQHPIIFVSARMPKQMTHLQQQAQLEGRPLVCYNGALVMTGARIVHSTEIPIDILNDLSRYNQEISNEPFHISLFHNNEWYAPSYDYWAQREENNTKVSPEIEGNFTVLNRWKQEGKGAHKVTCMGEAHLIEAAYIYLKKYYDQQLHLYRSKDTYIEIAPKSVSKLTGIQQLLGLEYPFKLEEAIAFGDNYNDVEMIAAVGHGVAVANARPEVLAVAKATTLHHKEDGVALYLSKLFQDL